MEIRTLNNGDCWEAVNLILPIQQIEFNVAVTLEDQPDLLDIEKSYLAGGGGFWGAFKEGQLIGTIALINAGHQTGAIRKMFVRKEYRGKDLSIAQTLFDTLLNYCFQQGVQHLYLGTVPQLKAAQRFYERNGFSRVEVEELPEYFPRMSADKLFYYLNTQTS
jgi:N-acetylglutamate synthase-like GNAT family acetyltransferase